MTVYKSDKNGAINNDMVTYAPSAPTGIWHVNNLST